MMTGTLFRALASVKWREFGLLRGHCPVCDACRTFVRLHRNEIGVRCLTCRATPVTMSLVAVLHGLVPDLEAKDIYELSSRGPLVDFLKKRSGRLTCSEYLDGVKPGEYSNGVLCQDVQNLTFPDNSFDICTSTEVFEHVPDDLAGFAEIRRVLRPGGLFLFTVPLFPSPDTRERARLNSHREIDHLLPAQYHGDPNRGHTPVLVFRDYGRDIVQRVASQGFSRVELINPSCPIPWNYARAILTAR